MQHGERATELVRELKRSKKWLPQYNVRQTRKSNAKTKNKIIAGISKLTVRCSIYLLRLQSDSINKIAKEIEECYQALQDFHR